MISTQAAAQSVAVPRQRRHRNWWAQLSPLTRIAGLGLTVLVLLALFAQILAPYDPFAIYSDAVLRPPSGRFWLGTDDLGRDLLSRILFGLQTSILIAAGAVALGTTTGTLLGLISGYARGPVDFVIQRGVEIISALPALVTAVIVVAVLGPAKWNVAIAIAVSLIPSNARVMRAAVLRVNTSLYCEAARAIGAGPLRVMLRHILPNCLGPILILATANFSVAILAEAGLSFLGLGVAPPEPSLGGMLSGAVQRYFYQAPWLAIFPGLFLTVLVICINIIGDALRDYFDPRLRYRI